MDGGVGARGAGEAGRQARAWCAGAGWAAQARAAVGSAAGGRRLGVGTELLKGAPWGRPGCIQCAGRIQEGGMPVVVLDAHDEALETWGK